MSFFPATKNRTVHDQIKIDPSKPHAFLSYTRFDDKYLNGGISALREALEQSVQARTGKPFRIFQDVDDIKPGDAWARKLDQAIEAAQLFIPILTPNFFTSDFCRREAMAFLDYEARAGRDDLVLPIYLLDSDQLNDEQCRQADEIARRLHERQYADWRKLRFNLQDNATQPHVYELAGAIANAVTKINGIAPPPAVMTTNLEERLSALEATIIERDRAIAAERVRNEQLEAKLAQQKGEVKQLAEERTAFNGQTQDVDSFKWDVESLRRIKSIKHDVPRVLKSRFEAAGLSLEWLGLRSHHMFGAAGIALLVGLGWVTARENSVLTDSDLETVDKTNGIAQDGLKAKVDVQAIDTVDLEVRGGETFRDCANCPEMVIIPEGSFFMGTSSSESISEAVERPGHEVSLQSFAIGKYEVTFDEWDACVDASGCEYRPIDQWGRGSQPVIGVSWDEAHQYINWLSKKTGETYRLPSEAEWEYAARAGTKTVYSWGNELGKNLANCKGCGSEWGGKQAAPAGSFAPNAFGLNDMHGNVSEWVADTYQNSYQGAPLDGGVWLSEGKKRVIRGGSWRSNYPKYLRSAARSSENVSYKSYSLGFRCVRVLD